MVSVLAGLALMVAAGFKLGDRPGAVVALSTYGFTGAAARPAWALLIALELVVGAAAASGSRAGAAGAAGLLTLFAGAQALALGRGRGGAPCGCLGGRGRVSGAS